MKDRIKRKLHSKKAFTLAEVLLAVLILVMVSVIVATGIPAARNAYERVVLGSNADILLSTTVSTLRNELGTARNIKTPSDAEAKAGTMITYYNPTRGSSSRIFVPSVGKQEILFQRYYSGEGLSMDTYATVPLISAQTATGDLYVTYDSVSYANGILTFSKLSVNRTSGTTGLALRENLSIRIISG